MNAGKWITIIWAINLMACCLFATANANNAAQSVSRTNPAFEATGSEKTGDAIADVEYIARTVAAVIEKLKGKYPPLENFSAAEHLSKVREQAKPRDLHPTLYSITYKNGILGTKPRPKGGGKRSVEYSYDEEKGVSLYVHFFVGRSRGADARSPLKIGRLSVHLYVSGPAAKEIESDIRTALDSLRKEYQSPHIIKVSEYLSNLADEAEAEITVALQAYRSVELSCNVIRTYVDAELPGGELGRYETVEPEDDGFAITITLHDNDDGVTRQSDFKPRLTEHSGRTCFTQSYLLPEGNEYLYTWIMYGDKADLTVVNKVKAMLETIAEE